MHSRRLVLPLIPLSLLVAAAWVFTGPVRAQDPVGDLMSLVNDVRSNESLHRYVISPKLMAAAQRHSEDMATTGQISHTGSDGSSSTQRILEAGYGAYEFGLVASENIFAGTGGAELPFNEWMGQPGARANLLHEKYREVGIGVASDAQGRSFWTFSVGAQPNVLPVFINNGVTSVDTVSITLSLTPENVVPEGRGTAMGQPVVYRASTSPEFPDADWAPWAAKVDLALDETPGEQTIYVQLRDAEGRTAISQSVVTLAGEDSTVTLTGTLESEAPVTPTVTLALTITPDVTATISPTSTRTATPTVSATPTGSPTPTLVPSATPQPTNTFVPSATATEIAQPTATATSPPPPTVSATTTSPPPTPQPPQAVAVVATPALPILDAGAIEEEDSGSLALRLAPWAVGLQILALALGVYVALRRPSD